MDLVSIYQGLQVGALLTSVCLVAGVAWVLLRNSGEFDDAWLTLLGILLTWIAAVPPYLFASVEYFWYGVEHAVVPPLWIRSIFLALFLCGGAIFMSLLHQKIGTRREMFWGWTLFIFGVISTVTMIASTS